MRFALDTPAGRDLDRVVRFSGWCLTDAGDPVDRLVLHVNSVAVVQLARTPRWDLADAFPQFPEAVLGGFTGDLVVPDTAKRGDRLEIALEAHVQQHHEILLRQTYRVTADLPSIIPRTRSYSLDAILEQMSVESAATRQIILGVPHFHDPGSVPSLCVLETGPTNHYSDGARAVMNSVLPTGQFLDLGCGIRRREDVRSNGVYLDAVHFRGVDVVSSRARLPLRDDSMDAVVSLNVFEHLPDPFAMAAEIRRVLKPGGTVWIETAFMQPMHADPGHYFNMTLEGLRRVASAFVIDEYGVLPHHLPSYSLRMQLDNVLPYMNDGEWKRVLGDLHTRLQSDGAALDEAMGPIGRRNLAAGVYIRGRKVQSD